MEEQLVSFETAKLAKDKGFNIPCNKMFSFGRKIFENMKTISFHNGDKNECANTSHDWNNTKSQTETEYYSAPTQSLLQKWLREKHNIHVNLFIYHNTEDINIVYRCRIDYFINKVKISYWLGLGKYEEVLEMGLKQGLNYIKL